MEEKMSQENIDTVDAVDNRPPAPETTKAVDNRPPAQETTNTEPRSALAKGLPEWSLEPPEVLVRRKARTL